MALLSYAVLLLYYQAGLLPPLSSVLRYFGSGLLEQVSSCICLGQMEFSTQRPHARTAAQSESGHCLCLQILQDRPTHKLFSFGEQRIKALLI